MQVYSAMCSCMKHCSILCSGLFPECRHGHPGKIRPCNSRGSCRAGVYQESGHALAASFCEEWNAQEDLGFLESLLLLIHNAFCYWPIVTNSRFYFRKISMVIWACWHQLGFFWCGFKNNKYSLIKGEKTSKNWTKEEEFLVYAAVQFNLPEGSKIL